MISWISTVRTTTPESLWSVQRTSYCIWWAAKDMRAATGPPGPRYAGSVTSHMPPRGPSSSQRRSSASPRSLADLSSKQGRIITTSPFRTWTALVNVLGCVFLSAAGPQQHRLQRSLNRSLGAGSRVEIPGGRVGRPRPWSGGPSPSCSPCASSSGSDGGVSGLGPSAAAPPPGQRGPGTLPEGDGW